jgi:hypothetical protein
MSKFEYDFFGHLKAVRFNNRAIVFNRLSVTVGLICLQDSCLRVGMPTK